GTHDNDTACGWYASAGEHARHRYRTYVGRSGDEPGWDLVRLAWASVARFAVAPLQDILGLGSPARMNTPGTVGGNWTWRAEAFPSNAATRLRILSETYGRLPRSAQDDRPPAC
ncbi:MAG: 4-alpha-glucanotransferase, partial [Myxococcota bacterium]|nr:4-alpha-glucanotransferase [Myxococcota bacterium]